MRILQLIDSLTPGGAERMAVNYANAIFNEVGFSFIVCTREKGSLEKSILKGVNYDFLDRRKTIDFKAIFKLYRILKQNKIDIIHAHSSSFFLACLIKLVYPKIKIVWHDHYGNSEFLDKRDSIVLKFCSVFFSGIISVNTNLYNWALKVLMCKNVIYFSNFIIKNFAFTENNTILKGIKGKRIVCLANLREQKNHFLLLDLAKEIKKDYSEWSFHLVGKDFEDEYSKQIFDKILEYNLENNVFIYGSQNNIDFILKNCDIGILTSKSEGLPVAILEYGAASLPVLASNVGEISKVISHDHNGYLFDNNDKKTGLSHLKKLIDSSDKRSKMGENNKHEIETNFSEKAILKKYLSWLKTV